ncbi:MAG: glutamate--tRNA ligase [Patescibacteria group bacterium]
MVRTRIAPSPTGQDVHVGSVATALMNYAWAKKNNGQFIIRIEDTDRTRLVPGGEEKMLDTLDKIGLHADESPKIGGPHVPYRQSERLEKYKKYASELVSKGKAYYCICTPDRLTKMREEQQAKKQIPKYDRKCYHDQEAVMKEIKEKNIKHVVRLLIPDGKVVFNDVVRGEVTIENQNLDDQVLLKSDGYPTYHLGVVVDDHLMGITHIIRGEEWLPSTPKHVILYRAFGWELPVFVHVPLLRNPDKSKLSKRRNPVWTSWYVEKGIFPEALLNYLALMGWSHPEGKEVFSLDEYIKVFDIKDIQKTAPVFDPVKLDWMNGEYIRKMDDKTLKEKITGFIGDGYDQELVGKTIPLVKERIKELSEYLPLTEFLFEAPKTYEADLKPKKELFAKITEKMKNLSDWKAEAIGEAMGRVCEETQTKRGEFFMNVRVAITGKKISPPLNESMEILGKGECLKRLMKAIA